MADITGTANGETLTGTAEADLINALAGEDEVFGLDGDRSGSGNLNNGVWFYKWIPALVMPPP